MHGREGLSNIYVQSREHSHKEIHNTLPHIGKGKKDLQQTD
jgi:hypothetical protein